MTKPIKVLHLIPTLSPGGAERQLTNLVGSTSDEKVEHVVCVIGEGDFFAPDIRKAGGKVIELEIFGKRPLLETASKFRRVIAEECPDLIHSWLYDANISARLAVFLKRKIPIITSLQLPDYEPDAIKSMRWNPNKVRGLKAIDKITSMIARPYYVACSEFVEKSYRRNFGLDESKTRVIYNSVDPDLLTASPDDLTNLRDELALPPDAFFYLNVGRLDPQKNHRTLFEAFTEVLREAPNAYLLLAGVGAMENELKEKVKKLEIGEKVIFLERRNDIGALLELADVFVFPSNFEGLGIALVEAMFKSLPCIASKIEVFQEFINHGETGLLIDQSSPVELKDAMIELYGNEDLRKSLGEKAFRAAEAKFRSDRTALQWEECYLKVCRKAEIKTNVL